MIPSEKQITKVLIRLRQCAGWSAPVLFPNPRRQVFSRRGPYVSDIFYKKTSYFFLQVAVAFWRAIGGAEDEVENLSDSD